MRTKEELNSNVARILCDLRVKKGLSRTKMAERVGVDSRTWRSWEAGDSSPTIIDFISVFESTGESMMRPILSILYPDRVQSSASVPIEELRASVSEFILTSASDHMVRVLSYILSGTHGSNCVPQLEEFCALDHLPMEQRYAIAEMLYVFYMMSLQRNELCCTNETMPDMEVWSDGLKASQRAAFRKLQSYTTIGEHK